VTILAILGFCTPSRSVTSVGKIRPVASPATQFNAVWSLGESMAFARETFDDATVVDGVVRGPEPSRDETAVVATMRSVAARTTTVIVRRPIRWRPVTAIALGSVVMGTGSRVLVDPC
jgi:hypothetical protein